MCSAASSVPAAGQGGGDNGADLQTLNMSYCTALWACRSAILIKMGKKVENNFKKQPILRISFSSSNPVAIERASNNRIFWVSTTAPAMIFFSDRPQSIHVRRSCPHHAKSCHLVPLTPAILSFSPTKPAIFPMRSKNLTKQTNRRGRQQGANER